MVSSFHLEYFGRELRWLRVCLPRRMSASGRDPRTWNALAPKMPGPRILKIRSPPEATNDSPRNSRYSYTTIRKRCPERVFEHGKKPYSCLHPSEESIPLKAIKDDDSCSRKSSTPSETNSRWLSWPSNTLPAATLAVNSNRRKKSTRLAVFPIILIKITSTVDPKEARQLFNKKKKKNFKNWQLGVLITNEVWWTNEFVKFL